MAYKVLANVILDGVAYEQGNVIDLSFLDGDVVKSLEERNIVASSNDEVTVVHGQGAAVGSETVAAPVEANEEQAVETPEAPLAPVPQLQTPMEPGQQPTPEQISQDLASLEQNNNLQG